MVLGIINAERREPHATLSSADGFRIAHIVLLGLLLESFFTFLRFYDNIVSEFLVSARPRGKITPIRNWKIVLEAVCR